jgi:hypothetical protein
MFGSPGSGMRFALLASGMAAAGRLRDRPAIVRGVAAAVAVLTLAAAAPHGPGRSTPPDRARFAASYRQVILPDLLVVRRQGLTAGQLSGLRRASANMIALDGGEIRARNGRSVSAVGVDPQAFRSWVPLRPASNQAIWTALARGAFLASDAARARLHLRPGASYQLSGAARVRLRFGGAAQLGVDGVDLVVNTATSRRLGLIHRVAALVSAPGTALATLVRRVRDAVPGARIITLRAQPLPVRRVNTSRRPANYLQLFQESAARYCPGLSWTVLAAIGQIESGDGQNMGPSSAGALGPMQFLPSTWKVWGIDGFGRTGPPDIMDAYDAVPSAARLLCANGAASGNLAGAIYDYNHAHWYVTEVLSLAAAYAREYS